MRQGSATEEGKVSLHARMTETWYQLQPLDALKVLFLLCCPPAIFWPWKMKNGLLWAWC